MQLLLISSSSAADKAYLEHARDGIMEFLEACPDGEVLFIPFAAHASKWDMYAETARTFFASLGQTCTSIHSLDDATEYMATTQLKAIFVAGGNTFLLTKTLQDKGLLEPIRRSVKNGVGYMGTSAGSNIACPTMQTTNDMPVVQPASFETLGLVDFQINPHFVPGSLLKGHRGETREQRIAEYLQYNDRMVIGLPELSWIRVNGTKITLEGAADAVLFEKDKPQRDWIAGAELVNEKQ